MRKSRVSFTVLACLVVFACAAVADTIVMKKGRDKLKVTVISDHYNQITYKKGGSKEMVVPSDQVKDVRYHSNNTEFKTAAQLFKSQDYFNAAEIYLEYADTLSDKKAALIAHCYYRAAESYFRNAMWDKALSTFTRFANQNQNHRLYPNALKARALCYFYRGDVKKASEQFGVMKKQVEKKKFGDQWVFEAKYWQTVMLETSSTSRAFTAYQDLYKQTKDKHPMVANKARLRIGRVLVSQKKFDEALPYFDEVIKDRENSERDIVAGAYLGRGIRIMMMKKVTKEQYKDALYDLLRVVVSYKDVLQCQPEAMYWAGKCFQRTNVKDSVKRWQSLFRRLKKEWPGSKFAIEAAQEI